EHIAQHGYLQRFAPQACGHRCQTRYLPQEACFRARPSSRQHPYVHHYITKYREKTKKLTQYSGIGAKRIHLVRTRGGNRKFRALRLDSGNFSWGSEGISRKARVIGVVFHPSNNELVRTNTLTKSAIVQIDAAPFRQW